MNELINPASTVGGVALLVMLLGVVTRLWLKGEGRHSGELKQARADYRAELDRVNAAHDAELAELRTEIKTLRERQDRMEAALDEERRRRHEAEDRLWRRPGGGADVES